MSVKITTCSVCSGDINKHLDLYDDRYGYAEQFSLLECKGCHHVFLKDAPQNELLGDLYTNYYPRATFDAEKFKPYKQGSCVQNWLVGGRSSACQSVPSGVSVLDIGCGYGETLAYLEAKGCDVYGVDADRNVEEIAKKFGFKIQIGLFDSKTYDANFFDYVTMNQVIEHVTDPHEAFAMIHQVLKPGGYCVLSTPNARGWGAKLFGHKWLNWHVPYHQQFLSKKSVALLASEHGFKVEKIETITRSEWLMYQVLHILNYPKQGVPSSFWAPTKTKRSFVAKILQKFVVASQYVLLPQLITRFFDAIGQGDNYLIVLRKKVSNDAI